MPSGTVRLHRVLRAPPERVRFSTGHSHAFGGWPESLTLLALLVEPEIPD